MKEQVLPVLMYHSIAECPGPSTRRLSVSPEAFAAQLDTLRRLGCTTLTFAAAGGLLASGADLPERAVVLTFDDGYADFHEHALPEIERHGFAATLFITTGWIKDSGAHAAGRPLGRMLTWDQVRDVADAGVEVGAHSHSHAQLDQLADRALAAELRDSKTILEEVTARPVRTLAYPYGYSSGRVRAAVAAAGYDHAASVANALARPRGDRLSVPRLTIRRSTDLHTFERIVRGDGVARTFLIDRALTSGWAVVRRARYPAGRVGGHG
jgi:peptidoglycan/xylan/chitin deacetylase (PgdA/CDA1 family)